MVSGDLKAATGCRTLHAESFCTATNMEYMRELQAQFGEICSKLLRKL